jgi:hypothetical protein
MLLFIPLVFVLSVWFGSDVSAGQLTQSPIRASIEREAFRMASSLATQSPEKPSSPAIGLASLVGQRVRITASAVKDGSIVGQVERVDDQTVTLLQSQSRELTVPLNKIARIEKWNGRRWSRGAAAVIGLVAGGLLGNRLGTMEANSCVPRRTPVDDMYSWAGAFDGLDCAIGGSIAIVMGTVYGGAAGTTIGALLPNQRWKTVPLSELITADPSSALERK